MFLPHGIWFMSEILKYVTYVLTLKCENHESFINVHANTYILCIDTCSMCVIPYTYGKTFEWENFHGFIFHSITNLFPQSMYDLVKYLQACYIEFSCEYNLFVV